MNVQVHCSNKAFVFCISCLRRYVQVVRPVSSMCRLKVWPYYVRETLGEGPPYDGLLGELTTGASHNEQEAAEV